MGKYISMNIFQHVSIKRENGNFLENCMLRKINSHNVSKLSPFSPSQSFFSIFHFFLLYFTLKNSSRDCNGKLPVQSHPILLRVISCNLYGAIFEIFARRYWYRSRTKLNTIFAVVSFAVIGDKSRLWAKVMQGYLSTSKNANAVDDTQRCLSWLETRDNCNSVEVFSYRRKMCQCAERWMWEISIFFPELHPLFCPNNASLNPFRFTSVSLRNDVDSKRRVLSREYRSRHYSH